MLWPHSAKQCYAEQKSYSFPDEQEVAPFEGRKDIKNASKWSNAELPKTSYGGYRSFSRRNLR